MSFSECPVCGVEIEGNFRVCTSCGAVLTSRCVKCGLEWLVSLGETYYPKCGETIRGEF